MAVVVPPIVYPVSLFAQLLGQVLYTSGATGIRARSWLRTDTKSLELFELGKGVGLRSLHNLGLAMDLVGTTRQVNAFRQGWLALGLDAVPEGDHLHVELDGPVLRRLGVDFRR